MMGRPSPLSPIPWPWHCMGFLCRSLGYATGAITLKTGASMQDVDAKLLGQLLASTVNQRRLEFDDLTALDAREVVVLLCADRFVHLAVVFPAGKMLIYQLHFFEQLQRAVDCCQ